MAVSRPKTHVYYLGNKEQCEKQRPRGFELARRMRQELEMNDYLTMHIAARTTELPNGDSFRILICHDMTWIYILSPEVTGAYEVVEEEWKAFDLYADPVICRSLVVGEKTVDGEKKWVAELDKIDCTAANRCTGSGADTANECASTRYFERTRIELAGKDDINNDVHEGDLIFTPIEFSSFGEDGTQHFDTENFAARMALNTLCEAMSKTSTHGTQRCYSSWSKTLDEYTAHAVLYYDANIEMNKWAVVYDKAGVGQTFRMVPGGTGPGQWPVDGYLDVIWCSNTDPYNTTAGYKAFDLWKEDVVEDSGETVGHVFLSITGDTYDRIHVFDLTATSYEAIDLGWRTEYETDNGYAYPAFPEGWKDRHIRLIGLVKRTAYWSVQDHYYGVPIGCSTAVYWENDTEQGSVPLEGCSECGAIFAILNEFTQEIEWMDRIACHTCEDLSDGAIVDLNFYSHVQQFAGNGVAEWRCSSLDNAYWTEANTCSFLFKGVYYDHWVMSSGGCHNTCNDRCDGNPCQGDVGGSGLTTYSYYEDILTETLCTQTGLETPGSDDYRDADGRIQTNCDSFNNSSGNPRDNIYSWWCTCNGTLPNLCATPYSGPNYNFSGARRDYDHWITEDDVKEAHVIPDGLGYSYDYTELNGSIVVDTTLGIDYNDVVETDSAVIESTLFDENFAQLAWPYYPPYAIMIAGTSCNKVIKTDKRKFSRRGDRFIDGISMKLSETFMDENCRFDMDNDKYSIVKGNDNTLYDNKGNEFNRTFEGVDVGFFFFSQAVKKTRKVNDYAD